MQPPGVHLLPTRPLLHRVPERGELRLALGGLRVRRGDARAAARLRDGEVLGEREPVADVRLDLGERRVAVVGRARAREERDAREPRREVQVRDGELVACARVGGSGISAGVLAEDAMRAGDVCDLPST